MEKWFVKGVGYVSGAFSKGDIQYPANWLVKADALELTRLEATARPEPGPGQVVIEDPAGWVVRDKTTAEVMAETEAKRASKHAEVNLVRDGKFYPGRLEITLESGAVVPVDLRDERDASNLDRIYIRATRLHLQAYDTPIMPFKDADNVDWMLTPAQALTICEKSLDFGVAVYQHSWLLKEQIAVATKDQLETIDVNAGWPTGV